MLGNRRFVLALLLYSLSITFLVMYFPNQCYKDGKFISFSLQQGGTVFPFWLMIMIVAFISYVLSLFV